MDRAHTIFLARALRDGELRLKAAIELWRRHFLPSARGDEMISVPCFLKPIQPYGVLLSGSSMENEGYDGNCER